VRNLDRLQKKPPIAGGKNPMKKIGLHIDALAVIIIVFLASFGFNLYQRYQYSDLLKEHVGLQLQVLSLELGMGMKEGMLERCENDSETIQLSLDNCETELYKH
jgi:hypothetical protein